MPEAMKTPGSVCLRPSFLLEWPLTVLIAAKFHDNTGRISPCLFCLWATWLCLQLCLFSSSFHSLVVKFVWQMLAGVVFKQLLCWHVLSSRCLLRFLRLGKGLAATESTCKEMKQLIVAGPVRRSDYVQLPHFCTVL